MTGLGTQIGALLAAGAVAVAGLLGAGSDRPPRRAALVIDAQAARDGRALVDPRLRGVDADVRLPRTADEARTDLRYFAAQGRRLIVAGHGAIAAANATGVPATYAPDLAGALAAVRR
ncbi:MAG TPA: hypothetical protein VH834_11920 [Solirubrobacteraceae bacterium]|jgi:hypothetical protein